MWRKGEDKGVHYGDSQFPPPIFLHFSSGSGRAPSSILFNFWILQGFSSFHQRTSICINTQLRDPPINYQLRPWTRTTAGSQTPIRHHHHKSIDFPATKWREWWWWRKKFFIYLKLVRVRSRKFMKCGWADFDIQTLAFCPFGVSLKRHELISVFYWRNLLKSLPQIVGWGVGSSVWWLLVFLSYQ